MKIALLGAESTGKTALAFALATHWRSQGRTVAVVPEVLREWCASARRTPRPEEQMAIAQEQERRADAAAAAADVMVADTTALLVAIYSGMLFKDGALYRFALARLHWYDRLLVMGLDLPWTPDGLQRVGPEVRDQVDTLVRSALAQAGASFEVVYGLGRERLASALAAIETPAGTNGDADSDLSGRSADTPRLSDMACERCSDARCEHRLFTGLL